MQLGYLSILVFTTASTLLNSVTASVPWTAQHTRDVYQWPNETFVENIAVRSNGHLLVTILSSPELWSVDPFGQDDAYLVHTFPYALGLLGITEYQAEKFAVIAGNFSIPTLTSTPGSYSVWTVDFTCAPPVIQKALDIVDAQLPNGMDVLDRDAQTVVIGDSAGSVFVVDLKNKSYRFSFTDPAFPPSVPGKVAIGLDGVKVRDGFLYFTNPNQDIFGRVRIALDGSKAGPVEIIVHRGGDDFTFDKHGNAWLNTNLGGSLLKITPNGTVTLTLGGPDQSVIQGNTAAAFGRTRADRYTLYITTTGGLTSIPPGGQIVGGKVVAFDTRCVGTE